MRMPDDHDADTMKPFRAIVTGLLVVTSAGLWSGCATPRQDAYTAVSGMKGIEKKEPSPTEDMNLAAKTGYYLGWLSLDLLYGFASGNPSFSP